MQILLVGDNSVFNQASEAKIQTELGEIEEKAKLIYSDKVIEKVSNNEKDKPTMREIVEGLREDGYNIEKVGVSASEVVGIPLDRESISVGQGTTNTIKVTLDSKSEPYTARKGEPYTESKDEPYTYYVLVAGKYYKMHFNGGVVNIDITPSDMSGEGEEGGEAEGGEKITLTATSENEEIATVTVDNETNTVSVTAKGKAGTVVITITYGNFSKTCTVKVCEKAKELEINSVRARIATGYTRWLLATVKPEEASQEFEWSSSDTNVATVDNKGVVTAKKAGKTTITVKTIDGSNLSKTCEVTIVENAPDVETLTNFQTKNTVAKDKNGNLITVPGDFKVLVGEGTKVTDGIVVQDKEGNEFVWVPVDSVSTGTSKPADDIRLGRYEDFGTKNATGNYIPKQDADNYSQVVTLNGRDGKYYQELTKDSGNTAAKNLGDFVTKTKANGGYYLGRYEASKGTDNKVKSQYNKTVWDRITQPNAASMSRSMYSNNYVESDLINSYSWDTAIVFIQKYSGDSNYVNKRITRPSLSNTGTVGDRACNIHDMASNGTEWCTTYNTYLSSYRWCAVGAHWNATNVICYGAGYRGYVWTNSDPGLTFRAMAYLK